MKTVKTSDPGIAFDHGYELGSGLIIPALHPRDASGNPAAVAPVSSVSAATPDLANEHGVVTHPVTQPTIVQQPPSQPIQVQTLPPVK